MLLLCTIYIKKIKIIPSYCSKFGNITTDSAQKPPSMELLRPSYLCRQADGKKTSVQWIRHLHFPDQLLVLADHKETIKACSRPCFHLQVSPAERTFFLKKVVWLGFLRLDYNLASLQGTEWDTAYLSTSLSSGQRQAGLSSSHNHQSGYKKQL